MMMPMKSKAGRRRASFTLRASCLALAAALLTPAAWAEPTDAERAGARAAANKGVEAFDAEKWQEALDYFLRAESIIHSPVHLSYIGRARAKLGQLVLAQEALMKVVHEQANSPAAERAKADAEEALADLEPRIPELTIKVEGVAGRSFQVTIDGAPVSPALVGIPGPVDPGQHVVRVAGDGAEAEQQVTLAETETKTITLTLPPSVPGQGAEAAPVAATTAETPPSDRASGGSTKGLMIGSIVGFGVGAAGIGLGVGFGLVASDKNEQGSQLCMDAVGNRNCSGVGADDPVAEDVRDLDAAAADARTISTVGFIAGGVGLAVGTTLLVLALSKKDEQVALPAPRGMTMRPIVSLDYLGLAGTF